MKYQLLTLAFFLFAYSLQAQTIKTYSGPYGKGNATYQYYEDNNGERVYNGSFTYKGLEGTIKITGTYKNGKRNGNWVCTLTNHFYIVMTMSGTIQVNYLNGNREGISTYSLSKDVNRFDVSGKETETGRINFKNNIPSGEYFFSLANKVNSNAGKRETNTTIKGSFDENGYKTGEWNIQSVNNNLPIEEVKRYKQGYCYWYISRISSTGEINKRFDSTEFANNYFKNQDEIFQKGNLNYALGFPKGSNISGNFDFIGDQGVNPIIDNTGDRFTIEDKEGMPLAQFIGNLGWDAFLNGKYEKCIELSNKALSYDSTLLYAKSNIALTKLKQKNPEYLNTYLSAVACCKNIEGRKETLEASLKDITDLTEKENVPNAERAIRIIQTELEKINDADRALAIQKQKDIQEQKEKVMKKQEEKIELANSDYGEILREVKNLFLKWKQKDEFETNDKYERRILDESEKQFSNIKSEVVENFKKKFQGTSTETLYGMYKGYDVEDTMVIVEPTLNDKILKRRNFRIHLSPNLAKEITKSHSDWWSAKYGLITHIFPSEYAMYNNQWMISKAAIIFDFTDSYHKNVDEFKKILNTDGNSLYSLEKYFSDNNSIPNKIYYYNWAIENEPNFSKEKLNNFDFTLADINNF